MQFCDVDYAKIPFGVDIKRKIMILHHKKSASIPESTFDLLLDKNYKADFTVLIILAAILYGSPLDAGLLSSKYPFQPFLTVNNGIRIEHPLSDTP